MLANYPAGPITPFAFAPFRLSGTVYTALLNHPDQLAALGEAVNQAPYKAAPSAPVLAVKPRNTLAAEGAAIALPAEPGDVLLGATLGIVVGRTACRLTMADAMQHVAGYLVAADLGLPLSSHYRPAVRARARDGFCPLGAAVPASCIADPDNLPVIVRVDGQQRHRGSTAGRIRGVAQLLVDVTEFMTLAPGDVLLLGAAHDMPTARIGQAVTIELAGVGQLSFSLVAETA